MAGATLGTSTATAYIVGTLMIAGLQHVPWDEPTEAIPAFLTVIVMPLSVSITEGVSIGLIAYVVLKLATGRARDLHPLLLLLAGIFLARYAFLS